MIPVPWSQERFAEWVAAATDQVEVRLRTTLDSDNEFIAQAARYLCLSKALLSAC